MRLRALPPRPAPRRRRSGLRPSALWLTVIALAALGLAHAQGVATTTPWRVGVIVSASGGGTLGQRQALAADRAAALLWPSGVYGQPVVVDVRDDRGDPRRAEALASELLEEGVLALICCTSAAASERVAGLAERHATVLLALTSLGASASATVPGGSWAWQLAAQPRTVMTAAAVQAGAEGKVGVALMTLDNAFGDAAEEAFERALSDAGRVPVGTSRYPPNATVLTPEGLWIATREPGSVIVWGLPGDTRLAIDGLRRRGYLGATYVRSEALPPSGWARLQPHDVNRAPVVPSRDDPFLAVRVAVPPVALADHLAPEHPNAPAVAAFVGGVLLGSTTGTSIPDLVEMATVADALQLLVRAFEDVAAFGLPPDVPLVTQRLAVRDALLSSPAQALAAGTYALTEQDPRAARWDGLVIAVVDPGP
jgi:ABC-type branched-subunit amino acid transport system substrate-binding protein